MGATRHDAAVTRWLPGRQRTAAGRQGAGPSYHCPLAGTGDVPTGESDSDSVFAASSTGWSRYVASPLPQSPLHEGRMDVCDASIAAARTRPPPASMVDRQDVSILSTRGGAGRTCGPPAAPAPRPFHWPPASRAGAPSPLGTSGPRRGST